MAAMTLKPLPLAVAALLAFSCGPIAAWGENTNTTIQHGRVNINYTFQQGDGSNENTTYQDGKVNINRTIQIGGRNNNRTGQLGILNRNKTDQRRGSKRSRAQQGGVKLGKFKRDDD
jgi:hypothetical protein